MSRTTVDKQLEVAQNIVNQESEISNITHQIDVIIENRINKFMFSINGDNNSDFYSAKHHEQKIHLNDVDDKALKDWMVTHLRAKVALKRTALYKYMAENK